MTQRRDELTNRIRKAKKADYLARKRSLPVLHKGTDVNVTSFETVDQSLTTIKALLQSYCQSMTFPQLQQIHAALERALSIQNLETGSSANPLVILDQEDKDLATEFLCCLKRHALLAATAPTTIKANDHVMNDAGGVQQTSQFRTILQILVQLTSIQTSDSASGSKDENYYGLAPLTWSKLVATSLSSWLDVLLQAVLSGVDVDLSCLVLGNIIGDGAQHIPTEMRLSMISGLINAVPTTSNAAWALTNMIRNDYASPARTYCSDDLLSTALLLQWLQNPTIATQTAWMIASLTAREQEVVMYLCRHKSFLSSIVQNLHHPNAPDLVVPLVEALGNISCYTSMVPPLLTQTNPPIVPLLQHILTHTPSRDRVNPRLLPAAAWLAGCLLVDVGMKNHPSTTVAAPALIPVLMERLRGTERNGLSTMTLEEERELVTALWNALSSPPLDFGEPQQQQQQQQHTKPDFGDCNISSRIPSPVNLPFELNVSRPTLQTLIRLASSKDADAVLASVHVLELLLRRQEKDILTSSNQLIITMREEGLPDTLEHVCDSPLEEAAEVAAVILDDFFLSEDDCFHPSEYTAWTVAPGTDEGTTSDNALLLEGGDRPGMGRGRGRGATLPAWMAK
jgi:hypothetical protein